ncbi:MAG: hypothetical protein A2Z06_02175, partial [Candidatus Glassbacteria bacterium RBG_16_58_8]
AHELGKEVFVAFNAPYYTSRQLDLLIPIIEDLLGEVDADGLIISDLGLMLVLKERGVRKPLIVSTLAVAHNVESVLFFREIGARRVILPRQLSLSEIAAIRSRIPDMEIEAFILNDTCVFEEGHCHTQHNVPGMESFCYTPWEYEVLSNGGLRSVDGDLERSWIAHLEDYREWLWYCKDCGYSMTIRGLTNGACGLCAIHRLHQAGIDVLKIVGRESSIDRKAKSVVVVRRVLDMVLSGATEDEAQGEARRLRDTPDLCDSGYMCYYRDALAGGIRIKVRHEPSKVDAER